MKAKKRASMARREPAFHSDQTIRTVDAELWVAIKGKHRRQQDHIELITSENYVSPAVMEAQGSQLTNKYAEGYPGKRYYGGCEFVDVAERLAIDRVKSLFGAEYANVQPHSGSQANQHDSQDASRTAWRLHPRHRRSRESAEFDGISGAAGGPLMHVIAAFKEALDCKFNDYQKQVLENSCMMARTLADRGLRIVSGGTDSHMFLVDLRSKKISGKDAEAAPGQAHITINKNAIRNDPEKPTVTSGLRVGSAAITTRGFGETEAKIAAHLTADVLEAPTDLGIIAAVADKAQSLCDAFPVYASLRS